MFPNRFSNNTGGFEITSMPGQSQVALCHSFFVRSSMRGRGHGHTLKAVQRHTLQALHYDYAICTVAAGNEAQKAVLTQAGWQKLAESRITAAAKPPSYGAWCRDHHRRDRSAFPFPGMTMTDEQPRYRTHIRLEYIKPSPTNPRKSFPEAELAELATSIKEHGLVTPILLRLNPVEGGLGYELISGERRWRAARLAGLTSIPAVIRDDLSDADIIEIQLIENLQRQDLHPLEEAEGYGHMMRQHGYTADTLADKIGKSRSYIFGRLKLLALSDDARRLFYAGLLNPSTALLIARIPTHKLQAKAIEEITKKDYHGDSMTVRQAQRWIRDRYMLTLDKAPFPIDDNALIATAGNCTSCPHRTGNARDLFDDVDSPDVCTDPDCYTAKKIAFRDREAEKVTAAGGKVILGDDAKKIAPYGAGTYDTLKGYTHLQSKCYDDPDHRTYAEILGDEAEASLLEDTNKNTLVPVMENKVLAEKLQAAGVKLRAQEEAKGNARVEAKLKLERLTRERLFLQVRDRVKPMVDDGGGFAYSEQDKLFSLITRFIWDRMYSNNKPKLTVLWGADGKNQTEREVDFLAKLPDRTTAECWQLLVDILTISGQTVTSEWDLERGGKRLVEVAGIFGIDPAETRKTVAAEEKEKEKAEKPTGKAKKITKKVSPATSEDPSYPSEAAQAQDLRREEKQDGATEAAPAGDSSALENPTAEEQSSAAGAAVEKPSGAEPAFGVGDRVRIVKLSCQTDLDMVGKTGTIEAIRESFIRPGQDAFHVLLDSDGQNKFTAWLEEIELIEKAAPPAGEAIESDAKPSGSTRITIQYQHPENIDLQWSGRGKKPKWVEHWMATGRTLEELKIVGATA